MKETSIDLVDLIRRILLRWKAIVIWMIIFAVLMDGFYYIRAVRSASRSADTEVEEEKNAGKIEEYEQTLTEQEITDAHTAARAYGQMYENYQQTLEYCENSIKMQLNAGSVSVATLRFYVEQDVSDSGNFDAVTAIADLLAASAKEGDVCDKIIDTLGWDTEASYVYELISPSVGNDAAVEKENVVSEVLEGQLVIVEILAPDEESAIAMSGIIRETIEDEAADLQSTFGTFSIGLVQEHYTVKEKDDLMSDQQSKFSSLNTLRTAMNNLSNNFSTDQKEYYNLLISGVTVEQAADVDTEETETAVAAKPKLISRRYVALGLLIGLVLVIVCVAIGYVFRRKLRVKEDVEELYHIPLLGFLEASERRRLNGPVCRGINRLFFRRDSKYSAGERTQIICAGIRLAAEKAGMKSIYITGSAGDAESEQLMSQLAEQLKDSVESISYGKSVVYDPESLKRLTDSDGVVLVERTDESAYADIERETELCGTYDVAVIGGIVIR